MNKKNLILLLSALLVSCTSNNIQTQPSMTPSISDNNISPLPSNISSSPSDIKESNQPDEEEKEPLIVKPYTIDGNTKKLFSDLEKSIGNKYISGSYVDHEGNVIFITANESYYHISDFNKLEKVLFEEAPQINSSSAATNYIKLDNNGNGFTLRKGFLEDVCPHSYQSCNIFPPRLRVIKNYNLDSLTMATKFSDISDPVYFSDLESGKGLYYQRDETIKVHEISNFTDLKFKYDIKLPDSNSFLYKIISDENDKPVIIVSSNKEASEYKFFNLKDDKLFLIDTGIIKNGISKYFIDSSGNGYIQINETQNEIMIIKVKNYNFKISEAIKIKSTANIRSSEIFINDQGNGLLAAYEYNNDYTSGTLNLFSVESYIIGDKIESFAKSETAYQLSNIKINKFGDGIIYWNNQKDNLYYSNVNIRVINDYKILK